MKDFVTLGIGARMLDALRDDSRSPGEKFAIVADVLEKLMPEHGIEDPVVEPEPEAELVTTPEPNNAANVSIVRP